MGIPCCLLPKGTLLCCTCRHWARAAGMETTFPASLLPDALYAALRIRHPGTMFGYGFGLLTAMRDRRGREC